MIMGHRVFVCKDCGKIIGYEEDHKVTVCYSMCQKECCKTKEKEKMLKN